MQLGFGTLTAWLIKVAVYPLLSVTVYSINKTSSQSVGLNNSTLVSVQVVVMLVPSKASNGALSTSSTKTGCAINETTAGSSESSKGVKYSLFQFWLAVKQFTACLKGT